MTKKEFRINKKDSQDCQIVELEMSSNLLADEVLLKVDKFAFTANNISYVVLGERMNYWDFFPTDESWGIVPTWGFADVISSGNNEIEIGERIYGYFPAATHVKVKAGNINSEGFHDLAAHRQHLSPIYNTYNRLGANHKVEYEAMTMLFRPLFTTAFLLDDFLKESNYFGAEQLLVTSASSKTALGLAYQLAMDKSKKINVIGLTSKSNKGFVESLGFYDSVITYDDLESIDPLKTCIAEFSGNRSLLNKVENHLGDQILYCSMIGLSHWDQFGGGEPLKMKHEMFFAPGQYKKRLEDWGIEGFQNKLRGVSMSFMQSAARWIDVIDVNGPEAFNELYLQILDGKVDPKKGYVVSLG